jgi:GNAT superfamily N-acetyltransferase
MVKKAVTIEKIEVKPLTPVQWDDFVTLFGPNGACAGCWCMWFLMTNKEFKESHKSGHFEAMRTLVHQGVEPGLIAYADGIPAGWVALAPRERYERLKTSNVLAPVDDLPVWSITCFFIHRNYRHAGLMEQLIKAGVDYAGLHGARIIEAYPYESDQKMSALTIYTGIASTFKKVGFKEVERRSANRPIMRFVIPGNCF